jgi:hypothetical protein
VSYWAELDKNNYVLRVIVCDDNDPNGDEGYKWLIDNLGGTWIKTSRDNPIQEKNAIVDSFYDKEKNIYIDTPIFSKGINWWFSPNSNKWERV